jgi:hypothetical protein
MARDLESAQQGEDRLWPEAEDEGRDGECGDAEFADGREAWRVWCAPRW